MVLFLYDGALSVGRSRGSGLMRGRVAMTEGEGHREGPPWRSRLLAVAMYFGLAPVLGPWASRRGLRYERHHYEQSLAVFFALFLAIVLYLLVSAFLSYVLVYQRGWYEGTRLEPTLLTIVRRVFLCWGVVWAFSVYWALRGSWGGVPLIGRLTTRRWALRAAFAGHVAMLAVVVATVATTVHAKTLTRADGGPGKAYFLFDDMGLVPHWMFDLGFYPIALAASDKWGADSVVVTPLSREMLAEAFAEGSFVFVLSHGTEAGLYTSTMRVYPSNAAPNGTGESLQLVYLTGCDSGTMAAQWTRALAPARVITFDRLSAWAEHIWWLLFRGAAAVRGLE